MSGIFHAYDIRGVFEDEFTVETAFDIGHALVKHLRCKTVVIGHDMRVSAPPIYQALMDSLVQAGCKVTAIGLCTTPMLYYALGKHRMDAGVMVTASHNPKQYIGMKLSGKDVVPISQGSGLEQIEQLAKGHVRVRSPLGSVHLMDISLEYQEFLKRLLPLHGLKVVVDCGNGMGALDYEHLQTIAPDIHWIPLYTELDGNFPNHEPNPLNPDAMKDLMREVIMQRADIGIAFDGDADRVGFVDEKGQIVSADLMLALLSSHMLKKQPKEHFLYDLRSSNIVREEITRLGGTSNMCRVGHGFIKRQMRSENAVLGAELACHYYFRDTFFADSGVYCALFVLNILSRNDFPLSTLIEPYRKYFHSGEINRKVKDADAVLQHIQKSYAKIGTRTLLDGVRVDTDSYWFNVRKSNTEPLIRFVGEAKDEQTLLKVKTEVLGLMK